jgi:hypothetical protein
VTIVYPNATRQEPPSFWQLVSGQIPRIVARAELRQIPAELTGREFRRDRTFRADLQAWMDQQWLEKDAAIEVLKRQM